MKRSRSTARNEPRLEMLESRRMLTADLKLWVNEGDVFNRATAAVVSQSAPQGFEYIDFGTSRVGEGVGGVAAKFKTLTIENIGSSSLRIDEIGRVHGGFTSHFRFAGAGADPSPEPPTTIFPRTLARGERYSWRVAFSTHDAIEFTPWSAYESITIRSNDPQYSDYRFRVLGQVVRNAGAAGVDYAHHRIFSNNQFLASGEVRANRKIADGSSDRIMESKHAGIFFEVDALSRVNFNLGGRLMEDSGGMPCIIRYDLKKETGNYGVLDIGERANKVAGGEATTGNITSFSPAFSKQLNLTLDKGRYVLLVKIDQIPDTGYVWQRPEGYPLGFDVNVRREILAKPQISVKRNGNEIARGALVDFGGWTQQGTMPEMEFTVTNSGGAGSTLNATFSVSGDFAKWDGLNGQLPSGQSDRISVELRSDRAAYSPTDFVRRGTITVTPTNPDVAPFSFEISLQIAPPPAAPPPSFAAFDPAGRLIIDGTDGADQFVLSVVGEDLVITRNGQTMKIRAGSVIKGMVVNCGGGNDVVSTSASVTMNQTLNGGAGNDNLRGGKGSDSLNGGDGNDYLDGGSRGDILSGGNGSDTAQYKSRTANLIIRIDGVANDGQAGEGDNVMLDVEHVIGGSGNDLIVGSPLRNRLFGGRGNDTLMGGGGDDSLYGEAGDDLLDGGKGVNTLVQ